MARASMPNLVSPPRFAYVAYHSRHVDGKHLARLKDFLFSGRAFPAAVRAAPLSRPVYFTTPTQVENQSFVNNARSLWPGT